MADINNILPVSVIMSVFREPENYLRESIESILNQTFKDFEFLIAIDDPNNERAIEIVSEYAKVDNRIKLFVNEKNLGLALSLNRLIEKAKGKYIARMDGDDVSFPERIKEQVKFMEDNPEIDILGTLGFKMDFDGTVYGVFNLPTDEKCIAIYLKNGFNPILHPSMMVKKEVFIFLNLYKNIPALEDYDFLLRAYLAGFKIKNLDKILLKFRVHSHKFRISSEKAWVQYIYTKKVIKFYIKQSNLNYCISEHEKKEFEMPNKFTYKIYKTLFNFSRKHFILAADYRDKKNFFAFIYHFVLALISPHRAEIFYRLIKTKLLCRLYNRTR
ncbi:MAG: glycosyltransferase [Candidatus Omnitrophica bacterium]|nr:glycosyltransferase [Candidatus Omnitrophota bacterium]